MAALPSLNALRAFEAVARLEKITRAADELNVTPTAVSRHIRNLEEELGVDLFEHSGSRLVLTAWGASYARSLHQAFTMIYDATDQLRAELVQMPLRLRAYTTFLVQWLMPRLLDFQRKYPSINLRITTAFDPVNFERDDVDLGIRYGDGYWPDVHATLLFQDEIVLVGDATESKRFSAMPLLAALDSATLLVHSLRPHDWPDWLAAAGLEHVKGAGRMALDDLALIYQGAFDGAGVGLVQRRYVMTDLAEHRLYQLSPVVLRRSEGFYLVCRPQSTTNRAVRAFTAWIVACMAEQDASEQAI
jgi:LysR family glycine cleavage system transcriptional activator